jgi:hypothetical protein
VTTSYILWNRTTQTVVEVSGTPVIFQASADANNHANNRLSKRRAAVDANAVYDVLTVTTK